jgi:hypothetical protein
MRVNLYQNCGLSKKKLGKSVGLLQPEGLSHNTQLLLPWFDRGRRDGAIRGRRNYASRCRAKWTLDRRRKCDVIAAPGSGDTSGLRERWTGPCAISSFRRTFKHT